MAGRGEVDMGKILGAGGREEKTGRAADENRGAFSRSSLKSR